MDSTEEAVTPLSAAGRALAEAGVRALVLSEPAGLPCADILLAHGHSRAGDRALDQVGWRRRIAGDGAWRLVGRRRYTFDGGFVLTVHHALPAGPLPSAALLPLARALWGASRPCDDGLQRCSSELLLVYLAIQDARGAMGRSQLAELRTHADRVTDWGTVGRLAGNAGVIDTLRTVLADRPTAASAPVSATGSVRALAWRAARVVRNRGRPGFLRDAVIGEPWRRAVTRCRFSGLELLAGPGTFLPRKVSEPLVTSALERLTEVGRPVVVDVGTGCGAVALALAHHLPAAEIMGVDVDAGALVWARRNARRLGLPRVRFAPGSLLDPLPAAFRGRVTLVVANIPCLPPGSFEGASDAPAEAYVGTGLEGLGLQRRLAEQARNTLHPGGWLLVQLAPSQWPTYRATLSELGYETGETLGDDVAVAGAARWVGRS